MGSHQQRGQSLIELTIAVAVGITFMTAAVGAIVFSLRVDTQNKYAQAAGELAQEILDQAATSANDDWHTLASLNRDTSYSFTTSTGFFITQSGSSTITLDGVNYDVLFTIADVYRLPDDTIVPSDTQNAVKDPSSLLIRSQVLWTQPGSSESTTATERLLTRTRNRLMLQTDWQNGSSTAPSGAVTTLDSYFRNATNTLWSTAGQLTILDYTANLFSTPSNGIDPAHRYAWNDVSGWIDFLATNTVSIQSTISGYAFSPNLGYISLDCATSPNGNICGQSTYGALYDSGNTGNLSGYAWNDAIGWISLNCSNQNQCATPTPCPSTNQNCTTPSGGLDYYAWIDASGYFHGFAWNDVVGWISFNCTETPGGCGAINYSVRTGSASLGMAELESLPFDTERTYGVGFNTIMWQGTLNQSTNVNFQIASSNCSNGATNPPTCSTGTWSFIGPDGTANTFYQPLDRNIQKRINRQLHNNDRYIRYKAFLYSDPAQSTGPVVEDIIVNWSR